MGKLDDKVAVITGGSSGIGAETARLFVQEGASVVIVDVQDETGEHLAQTLGGRAIYQHTDVGQEPDVKAVIDFAWAKFGRLDCVFNNAGFAGVSGPIEETALEGYEAVMAVLLRGVFLGIKHATPVMKRQGWGSIINTGSVAGLRTGYGPHIYSTAKAAVIHLTRCVAMELGESNVRVNCICPGGIATPIFLGPTATELSPDLLDERIEQLKESLAKAQPIQRSGIPKDIAHAALWLASDDSTFVNGHALVVDGGLIGGQKWSESRQKWS